MVAKKLQGRLPRCCFQEDRGVTRNKWRYEMIKRGAAGYNSQTGKWEWGEPPKKPKTWEVQ